MFRMNHLIAVALASFARVAVPFPDTTGFDPASSSPRQDLRGERALDAADPLHMSWQLRPGP